MQSDCVICRDRQAKLERLRTALTAALDDSDRLRKELSRWIRDWGEIEGTIEALDKENRKLRARVVELESIVNAR